MLEQEIASAIRFIIEKAGNPAPYYYNVPQNFIVPAVYFPPPEIDSSGDTLSTYALTYSWFVKFFHKDTQLAYSLGLAVLTALQGERNVIPLIDENGEFTARVFRMKDPELKTIDDGAVQLTLTWDSNRPYSKKDVAKMQGVNINIYTKGAYESALKIISEEV